jgi:uncharacterized protein
MSTEVRDNPDRTRYEISINGAFAGMAAYRDINNTRVFTDTDIKPGFEGEGLGSTLIGAALDDVRSSGRSAVALCPFVANFIEKNPTYADLINQDLDARLRREE